MTDSNHNARAVNFFPKLLKALEELHMLIDFESPVIAGEPMVFDDPSGVNEVMKRAMEVINEVRETSNE